MFTFQILVKQGGKSGFSVCVTQQTPAAPESALICLPASAHKDLHKTTHIQTTLVFSGLSPERAEWAVMKSLYAHVKQLRFCIFLQLQPHI